MAKRIKDKFRSLDTHEVVFPTQSGSIKISAEDDGKFVIGALTAPGVKNALVIDPINNQIITNKVKFSDGTSLSLSLIHI